MFILILSIFIRLVTAGEDSTPFFDSAVLEKNDLVDVQLLDSTIAVHLAYATADNFTGKNMYGTLTECYLRREAAEKLVMARKLLTEKHPGYRLYVYDGLRPRRIQQYMWDLVKNTPQQSYVANPASGSIHNYGAAIDLTIADEQENPIDMGTPFDYFDVKAQPRYETYFSDSGLIAGSNLAPSVRKQIRADIVKSGLLSTESRDNRLLLRSVMEEAGFVSIPNEWWHFNAFEKNVIRKRFTIIE